MEAEQEKILIILGMHRSGTSLAANWLSRCGLNLGDRLMAGSLGNIGGHYEDLDFYELHEAIFRENKIPYGGLQNIGVINMSTYHQKKMESILQMKMSLRTQWGWKEPRTCVFLNEYQKLLPQAYYLVLYRNAGEVVDSLLRREYKKRKNRHIEYSIKTKVEYLLMDSKYKNEFYKNNSKRFEDAWICYNRNILELPKKTERIKFVSINNLLNCSSKIANWLKSSGFELDEFDIQNIYKPEQLMTKSHEWSYSQENSKLIDTITSEFTELSQV